MLSDDGILHLEAERTPPRRQKRTCGQTRSKWAIACAVVVPWSITIDPLVTQRGS